MEISKQHRIESIAQMQDAIRNSFRAKQVIVSDVSITSHNHTKKSTIICLYHVCYLIIDIIMYKDQEKNFQIIHKTGIFEITTENSFNGIYIESVSSVNVKTIQRQTITL